MPAGPVRTGGACGALGVVFSVHNDAPVAYPVSAAAFDASPRIERREGARWVPVEVHAAYTACESADAGRVLIPASVPTRIEPHAAVEFEWNGYEITPGHTVEARPCSRWVALPVGRYRATVFGCGPAKLDCPLATGAPVDVACSAR